MSAPIRIGLIGTGRIGSLHARLIAREVPGLELAAVYDVDQEAARAVGRAVGVDVAASADDVLGSPTTDAIAICTSTDTHVDLVVAASEIGKPVFVEKPISLDLAATDRVLTAADRAKLHLQVGFNRRFDLAHSSVRDAVAAGKVGELHLVRISSRDPGPPPIEYIRISGGIFLDMTVHDFDMARFVTGSEVEEVYALGDVRIDPAIGEAGDLDTTVVALRHADRTLTMIDNSRRSAYGYDQRVEAFGSAGMAASENAPAHTGVVRTAEGTRSPALSHFFTERYVASYLAQWAEFERTVRAGEGPLVNGADGRAALVLGLAAGISVRERRPVRTSEIG